MTVPNPRLERNRRLARAFAAAEFPANRRGHGGGPCTRRVYTQEQLEALLLDVLCRCEAALQDPNP